MAPGTLYTRAGLLLRVADRPASTGCVEVDRWTERGWSAFGEEPCPVERGYVEGHHDYAEAWARRSEPAR